MRKQDNRDRMQDILEDTIEYYSDAPSERYQKKSAETIQALLDQGEAAEKLGGRRRAKGYYEKALEKIPLKTPFITALREVKDVEFIRVKIICSDGVFAYGEAPATKAITGEDLKSITLCIEKVIKPQILHSFDVS